MSISGLDNNKKWNSLCYGGLILNVMKVLPPPKPFLAPNKLIYYLNFIMKIQ